MSDYNDKIPVTYSLEEFERLFMGEYTSSDSERRVEAKYWKEREDKRNKLDEEREACRERLRLL